MGSDVAVKRIKKALELPKCCATLTIETQRYWVKGRTTCQFKGAFRINNKPYCTKHAGLKLIDLHLSRSVKTRNML